MISNSRRKFLQFSAATAGSGILPGLIQQALAVPANNITGTLADVGHVVIFMQENRSFDHYFGTLAGVRGFDDPRAITLPNGSPVWQQPNPAGGSVLPFHFDAKNTSALSVGTNHSWKGSQQAWQGWDAWVGKKTVQTMGYFDRGDLPFYYALADAFTICDAYHCSVFGATDPNRMYSLTGTNQGWLGAMGSLYNIDARGYYNGEPANDNISPAVTASAPNWQTYAEVLEANQVSWKVYQEWDNYGDNYLAYFRNFRVNADGSRLSSNSPLYQKARTLAPGASVGGSRGDGLVSAFADDIRNRRLPQVSWICAPNDYTEHAPNSPNAGENLTARLLAALVAEPEVWAKTVFLLMYDENDGFFDHVPPDIPPITTAMGRSTLADNGYYEKSGTEPVGLGPRVPMLVISPWSKGGKVCSQLFDHTSKLRFLEEWLVNGLGKSRAAVTCSQISPWRRTVCGDLTSAFDFRSPDQNWPATVPKSAAYVPVSGKPYPAPPANQVQPRQEAYQAAQGPRPACRLPYELAVHVRANTSKQVEVSFINTGTTGAAFIVYSRARSDGPWYYTVEAGKQIQNEIWNWSGDSYHLAAYGPNGFMRECRGSVTASSRPEVQAVHDTANGKLLLSLSNADSNQACNLTISDNASGLLATTYTLAGGQTLRLEFALTDSFGWYDFSISSSSDAQFLRRLAGHIEATASNSFNNRTDPRLGGKRNEVSLTTATPRITHGSSVTVSYAVPQAQVNSRNWIGVYTAGAVPGQVNSLVWQYAGNAQGSITLNTTGLAAGNYAIWFLYNDAYTPLTGQLALSIV
ncbi:phospholipase C, phosphocholine-specific [Undibacterium sp. TS12]|uniref:phosphocholine-specific phospholipase C n=1 Tax=Undibacterium sp. TS12 TaxID=2908202 RepID=UPI001F4D352E|nr:phospholipase C, phosphocholine-specific [Undibacterium sp. TS12]MCH8619521.1 phospholipase C, phosphocholine-specific [Undibacterium sp. TS12]